MTLQIPRVPSPESTGFHFDAAAVQAHQTRQALAEEIRGTIRTLIASIHIPGYKDTLRKFLDAVEPGSVRDWARLPYVASGPYDKTGTKIGVVCARLSWVIQHFWDVCFDGADYSLCIEESCRDLRAWAVYGIDKCELCGNSRLGYCLRSK
jgi:hypothetical protein